MRRARLRTESDDAEIVAAALVPDNTDEMETQVGDDTIETLVTRGATGGLRTTVDDYVVNLSVAERVVGIANEPEQTNDQPADETQP